MTTVAYDGKTLAADRMVSSVSRMPWQTRKIHELVYDGNMAWAAGVGPACRVVELIDWIRNGANPEEYRYDENEANFDATVIVVDCHGTVICYADNSPYGFEVTDKTLGLGSGGDFAKLLMDHEKLNYTAQDAVRYCSKLDQNTGKGVTWVDIASGQITETDE